MNAERRRANLLLLLAAAIWGFAFVAQRVGMRHLQPLAFNGIRFAMAALVLAPLLGTAALGGAGAAPRPGGLRRDAAAGLLAGLVLFAGATLQQWGVVFTTAGKAGFITSLYVVFVPLMGLAVGQRCGRAVWAGVALAAGGLYLLSARGLTRIAPGDGLVLLGAVCWAGHVLVVGHFVRRVPPLRLAVGQFVTVALLSLAGAALWETTRWPDLRAAAVPLLYAGLLSVAVAYTLQVWGQRHARPAHAAVILSLESVFAALGGWWLLGETLGPRELLGCGLMFAGVLMAQRDPAPPAGAPESVP